MRHRANRLKCTMTLLLLCPALVAAESNFSIERDDVGVLLKTADGKPVLRYVTKKPADSKLTANSACFLHPIYTPAGKVVTDLAPDDHRHHRGAFLGWFAMHGSKDADYWGWGQYAPTKGRVIENRDVKLGVAIARAGTLVIRNDWMADGDRLIQEDLRISARQEGDLYIIDWFSVLRPFADIRLDQSAFSGFCVRSRKDGKFTIVDPKGEVTLPDPHHLKPETDWPSAPWYAFSLQPADGGSIGLALIDHPLNPPSKWHNNRRVWMLNPCITALGSVMLTPDKPLTLRYRMVTCDGEVPGKTIDRLAAELRPTYGVRHMKNAAIQLDGRPDEAEWSKANVNTQFRFPWKAAPAPATEFRALCDDRHLYFAYRVQDADIVVVEKLRDKEDIVLEDRVEMVFSRDDALKDYYAVEIDSRGRFLEYRAAFYRQFDMTWTWEGFEAKASPIDQGYVVEGRISLAGLEKMGLGGLRPGARILCGLYRAEFSHDRRPPGQAATQQSTEPSKHTRGRALDGPPPIEDWISWIDPKTAEPDFHVPTSLGWLQIEE